MITVRAVVSPGSGPSLSAQFGPDGGTIGRADTNTLVLPDPDRMVSRVHAQIMKRPNGYVLIDRGSNPVSVNGQQLGAGKEVPIKSGDQIQIGNYVLAVEGGDAAAAAPAPAPAAAAGGGMSDPLGLFSNQVAHAAPPAGRAPPAAFGNFGVPGAASEDPFADLLPSAPAPQRAFTAPPPVSRGGGGIPDDWDPLADPLGEPPKKAAPDQLPDDFDFGASLSNAPATSRDLDQMLGIGGASSKPLDSRDPFLGTPLGDPLSNPNTAPIGDPLSALYATHDAGQRAEQDQVPEVHGAFIPPRAELPPLDDLLPPSQDVFAPAPPSARPASGPSAPSSPDPFADLLPPVASPPPAAAFPSSPPVGGHVISPAPAPAPTPAAEAPAPAPRPAPPPPVVEPPPPPPPSPAPRPTPAPVRAVASGPVSQDELLNAFLTGLGVQQTRLDAVTPELMELVGTLLRDATEGTLQLLLTRQETKREVQAEVTMIMAKENNPLKFSPTVEHALALLLEPPTRGFLPPREAMRDAYEDLRAHQFGVMAGMRAALEGVVAKFSPDQLEKRLTDKTMLDSLFAGSRKAKLWDQFVALYGDIAQETNDDFQAIFGKAFVKAYQEQVDRLKQK